MNEKKAALPETERLIDEKLDAAIRKIVREEVALIHWRDLATRFPKLAQILEKSISASLERMSESDFLQNSGKNSEQ